LVKLEICKFWLHCGAASIDKFSKGAVNKKSLKKKRTAGLGYSTVWCLVQVAWRYDDDEYVSCTFPYFENATNLFNATGHHACSPTPTKISTVLPTGKTFGLN